MLKDIIEKRGESVYKIAKKSGIPYTTLNELVLGKKSVESCTIKTVNMLASYFGMSTDRLYSVMRGEPENKAISQTWQEAKWKKYTFPVRVATGDFDIVRIHPLKQKEAIAISEALKDDDRVAEMIVFGSATNIRCGRKSDIDVAVRLKQGCINNETKEDVSEKLQTACSFDADVVWLDRVKPGSVLDSNIRMGVKLK